MVVSAVLCLFSACSGAPSSVHDRQPAVIDAGVIDAVGAPDAADVRCDPVVGEPALALELVASGFDKPVYVAGPRGDDRLFVVEQHTGRVRLIRDGEVSPQPYLDLGTQIGKAFEQGLLSIAFHPGFATNGRLFVAFTPPTDELVIEEWQVDPVAPVAVGPRAPLLVIPQDKDFHYGGKIAFGPDGYLYLGRGDGGPQLDADGHAQDLGSLRGKFLRIDVDRQDGELPYAIPPDNPFVAVEGARPEIYAYGVRNPWGWSIDPATGNLYFGDVGLNRWEEINVIPATRPGANYGWPILLGEECVEAGCDGTGMEPPLHAYAYVNQQRCAVVGGPVYRGCRMPGHHGRYFFSDFCAGFIHSLRWSELDAEPPEVFEHPDLALELTSSLGVDHQGEILALDWQAGTLHRLVPAP